MPPDPPRWCVLTHTDLYTVAPPYSHKTLFCPPLSYFLDEGLLALKVPQATPL